MYCLLVYVLPAQGFICSPQKMTCTGPTIFLPLGALFSTTVYSHACVIFQLGLQMRPFSWRSLLNFKLLLPLEDRVLFSFQSSLGFHAGTSGTLEDTSSHKDRHYVAHKLLFFFCVHAYIHVCKSSLCVCTYECIFGGPRTMLGVGGVQLLSTTI